MSTSVTTLSITLTIFSGISIRTSRSLTCILKLSLMTLLRASAIGQPLQSNGTFSLLLLVYLNFFSCCHSSFFFPIVNSYIIKIIVTFILTFFLVLFFHCFLLCCLCASPARALLPWRFSEMKTSLRLSCTL
jgi:hypothetical protein